ncbi:MAG TPA: molybdopterin cofactor-binding domain-containing protein, partial [Pseudolabrys sp.]|nr:molybdopterin cofactor-binding domain-containing protein [Pseudolabrys sp.]
MNQLARATDFSAWTGRVEDDALLRGQGRYGDDVKPEGALAAHFVRSPHAFAKIERIDTTAAKSAKGVVAVLTAADLEAAHYHSISHPHPIPGRGGQKPVSPHRPVLAGERVMHVGEPMVMVIATSAALAQDAADQIVVDYEQLDAVTDARDAIKPGAPQLWPDAPANIGFDWTAPADADGKKQAVLARAFKDAAHVVKVELVNQRLVVASLEPRTASASYDAASGKFTLRCATQGFASVRAQVAGAMNIKPEELRIVTEDLGGAFGMKGWCYPEYITMLHAARELKRPIHWVSTRSEAFVTDNQGRDSFWTAELALNKRGRFLGLKVDCIGNMGAYFTGVAHFCVTTHVSGCLPTVYDVPVAQLNSRCVFTNTLPTGPYRGAGRPE